MFCDFIWVNAMESPAKDRCPVRPQIVNRILRRTHPWVVVAVGRSRASSSWRVMSSASALALRRPLAVRLSFLQRPATSARSGLLRDHAMCLVRQSVARQRYRKGVRKHSIIRLDDGAFS
jgi:hypothetical protein